MSVAMSVAPSASSLSCSCLQAVRKGAVWAGDGRPASEDQHRTALSQLWPRAAVASLHPCSPVQLSCSYPATPAGTPRHRREAAVALTHTQYLLFGRPRLQVVQRMREAGEALRAQLELRRRRLAFGLEGDLGGEGVRGCASRHMHSSETWWVLMPGGLVDWWSGGLVVWWSGV